MKKDTINLIIAPIILVLLLCCGAFIFKSDYFSIIKFWLTLLMVGIIFFPLTSIIFKQFNDKGWFFSKIIGISISAWLMWLLSYTKLFSYTSLNCYLILLFILFINIITILLNKSKLKFNIRNVKNVSQKIIISEIIFVLIFFIWLYLRGFNPAIDNSTEKYMDYGFMNSIMNSKYMPPEDIWFSGNPINYYYFGQYLSGYICKISNVSVNEGYNLMLSLIASCTFIMPFIISYNLLNSKLKDQSNRLLPCVLAFLVGFSICFGGTLYFPIYRYFSNNKADYFYANATRYIGYQPDTSDKGVTENPAYSNILGDLHAHYIGLIFSFMILALLLIYLLKNKKQSIKDILLDPVIILIGFILGIQKMTNYWDFPIYLVIISCFVVTKNLIYSKIDLKLLLKIFVSIFEIILIQAFITLPFTFDLDISTAKVYFTHTSSALYQLAVLWGLPSICLITFFIYLFKKYKDSNTNLREFFINHLIDIYILILGICALGLVLIPELVYLKDIYGDIYKRFNTMFKLTYEAYILFAFCINYIILNFVLDKNKIVFALGSILLVINLTTFAYGIDAIYTINADKNNIGLSSSEYLLSVDMPNDYNAIQWIKQNIDKNRVILEASNSNSSYSHYARISTFSGNPTVLGWVVHEWLWRMNEDYSISEKITTRSNDIYSFYNSNDIEQAKNFIEQYNVSYIYVGDLEYQTYPNLNIDFLSNLGEIVYSSSNETNDTHNTYIIKVK